MSLGLTPLPMSIQTLLSPSQVESQRLEFKATWDDRIKDAVIESACAFANDLLNLNGGYIVLGLEQDAQGRPVLPPRGVDGLDLDRVMKDVFGACKQISPDYQPIPFLETYQDRQLLILFCPGGDNRPYQAPNYRRAGQKAYFVRQGPLTTIAQADTLRQLMEQASKIPWDDRRCLAARFLDVSPTLVRRHLHQAGSHLAEEPLPDAELYRKLRLTVPVNAHTEPRNVALLFFQDDPTRFFPGARIELCEFPEGRGGDRLIEHTFSGPLPEQLRACQNYLEGMLGNITEKPAAGLEAQPGLLAVAINPPLPGKVLQVAVLAGHDKANRHRVGLLLARAGAGALGLARVKVVAVGPVQALAQGCGPRHEAQQAAADLEAMRESLDLPTVDDIVRTEVRAAAGRHPDVEFDRSGVVPVQASVVPAAIGRVVQNLVDNAAAHARGRVRVRLGVLTAPDPQGRPTVQWELRVDDDGPGVPPADRDRVFERFARLDESRSRRAGGTGLGLAIVRELVAEHGGTVRVDDSDLGGASFVVRVPVPLPG